MSKKKYLVTGGTGFIGRDLVRRLVKEGNSVRVLDNNSRGDDDALKDIKDDYEFVQGDIRDADVVEKASRGIESVFHLAYINGTEFFYTKPELVLEVGVKGMTNVLDACIKHNIKEMFLASSSEVYQTPPTVPTDESVPLSIPDPSNPRYSYGGGKIISELMAMNYGKKYFERMVIFRPHNVYGPNMGWEHVLPQFVLRMREIVHQTEESVVTFPIQGTGDETRAFVYIEDFTDGLMVLKDRGEHLNIYHIGTSEEIAIRDVAKHVGQYFKRDINIVPSQSPKGGTYRRCPDISKIKSLGYAPKFSMERGLPLLAQWYDQHASLAPKEMQTV